MNDTGLVELCKKAKKFWDFDEKLAPNGQIVEHGLNKIIKNPDKMGDLFEHEWIPAYDSIDDALSWFAYHCGTGEYEN